MIVPDIAPPAMRTLPFYDLVSLAEEEWRSATDISAEMLTVLKHGIRDMPTNRVLGLPEMGPIPQDSRSIAFGEADLAKGLQVENGFYRKMTESDLTRVRSQGKLISSAFTVWQEKDGIEEGRFVICLNRQSKFFRKRPTRMEGAVNFCAHIQKDDHMISFDVKSGYRHLKLHRDMIDDFVFCYNGEYYQCLAMPFGWGPAAYWFTVFLAPVIRKFRLWGYLVLVYIDDVLVIPRRHQTCSTTEVDCLRASRRIGKLLTSLGITKHPSKGYWGHGVRRARHLGFIFDTSVMMFFVPEGKQKSTRAKARALLREVRFGRRWVTMRTLSKFLGVTTSTFTQIACLEPGIPATYSSVEQR